MAGDREPGAASAAASRVTPLMRRLLSVVVLGFAAIVVVLAGVWISLDRRHRAVEANVVDVIASEGAVSGTAYAMENATTAVGLAIDAYVVTGATEQRDAARRHARAFDDARARYVALSRTTAERALGDQVAALHQRQLEVGGDAMDLRDRREAVLARMAADFARFDAVRSELGRKWRAALPDALSRELDALAPALAGFLATPDAAHRDAAQAALGRVRAQLERPDGRPLAAVDGALSRVRDALTPLGADVRDLAEVELRAREAEAQLAKLRGELEALHHTIQGMAHVELAAASQRATHVIRRQASLWLAGASVLVASLAGAIILWRSLQLRNAVSELEVETRRRVAAERDREELLARTVSAQEEERARISRELHDQIGQKLSALVFGLDGLGARAASGTPVASERDVHKLRDLASELLDDAQSVAHQLRPPELADLGLQRALAHMIEDWQARYAIPVDFYSEIAETPLGSLVEVTLYRVVQEALANVRKHAGAHAVSVVLKRSPGAVRLVIEDDGRGFEPERAPEAPRAHGPLGLRGIRERVELAGGKLTIESGAGRGTTLLVVIPLP